MNALLGIIAFLILTLALVEWAKLRAARKHESTQSLIRGDIASLRRDVKGWLGREEAKLDGGGNPTTPP